jgi:PadR family transcriptional regulator PadR
MHRMTEGRQSQLLRGVLDACVLAVISDEPAYGYEMTRRLGERGLDVVGEGSIYPVLGRLERQRLVETFSRPSDEGGPPRKYYRLTAKGRRSLRAWREEWASVRTAVDAVLETIEMEA